MGISKSNIFYKINDDVTYAVFEKIFSKNGWLDKRVKDDKTEIYFYYAGHGAPEYKTNKAYLIPFDGDPNYSAQTGYELNKLYENISNLNSKSVTVFLDACFSGASRDNNMLLADARPIYIEVSNPLVKGNFDIFTAASGKEISSAYPQKHHGIFTYFLLKGLKGDGDTNTDGELTTLELSNYIKDNVSDTAHLLDREQNPTYIGKNKDRVLVTY